MRDADKSKVQPIGELAALRQRVAQLEQGKLKAKLLLVRLRAEEEKFRSMFENAPIGIFLSTIGGKIIDVNPEAARILGYDSPEEIIAVAKRASSAQALYVDPESRLKIVRRALENKGEWIEAESYLRRKTGESILVRFFFRNVPAESGESDFVEGFMEDITGRRRADVLLRLQRDLALALGSTSSMTEALERLMQVALKIEGIDSGGVYLMDAVTGELQIISHAGLSSWFIDQVSYYAPGTPQVRLVMQGEPAYLSNDGGDLDVGDLLEREGLTSLAVIPVKFNGQVVAVLNLASRTQKEVPETTRSALEAIAAQIGGIVNRVNVEEALKIERENLAEANVALKVLLRHREEDRRELEEALLTNVENLITPYLEKLMNTRLSSDQMLFLEIIQSNLREITSPFLGALSHLFIRLTPMEIRVADLIRHGRTTKEIATILRTSERSILFHRQRIRGKLGVKSKKMNLRSYLSSLA
jgi:PAS domain S-box-containing protein